MTFRHYPCANPLWLGLPIDLTDMHGTPIHIGDRVKFDADEWGGEHEFIVGFESGEVLFSGTGDDMDSFATVVQPYAKG